MKILNGESIFEKKLPASVVTIGNFDGVHRGHSEIFTRVRVKSAEMSLPSVAVTFEPHPLKLLAPDNAPPMITTPMQKFELIKKSGIDYLLSVPFTPEFASLAAEEFVREILCGTLGMKHIVIGHDYAFGRGRGGNFATLEKFGARCGFSLEDIPPIGENGLIFSSSQARSYLAAGNMVCAAKILGRCYQIEGKVVRGRGIGHSIGFPTANIATDNELIPLDGVYAVIASIGNRQIDGVCSIGINPTFGTNTRSIEVYLFDFYSDIYDATISISFVDRLRGEEKFCGVDALKEAIAADVESARSLLDRFAGCLKLS